LGLQIRIRVVQPFVVIYAYDGREVTILRVVDGRRKMTQHLSGH
jgi:plasmid stabilization system protein ParE